MNGNMTYRITRLCGAIFPDYKEYFNTESISDEQAEAIKRAISKALDEREAEVVTCRFGLDGNEPMTLDTVGSHLNVTRERVRQIEIGALKKLKNGSIPALFKAPKDINKSVKQLGDELEELYRTPEFKRAQEIVSELETLENLPFRYTCPYKARHTDLDELRLSARAYNCLRRAGINTTYDIVNLPKGDWLKVRCLGHKTLREVVEKMHELGYEDFDVEVPFTLRHWPA